LRFAIRGGRIVFESIYSSLTNNNKRGRPLSPFQLRGYRPEVVLREFGVGERNHLGQE
jgi:hypothetical protein